MRFNKKNKGITHAINLFKFGSNIIDVGGESTRPGSKTVSDYKEWKRIESTIKKISKKIPLSLDTRKSEIMKKGIKLGVKIINDVSGLEYDLKTVQVLKEYKIPFVIHHSQGTPENMQIKPSYKNVLLDIYDFFDKNYIINAPFLLQIYFKPIFYNIKESISSCILCAISRVLKIILYGDQYYA